MATQITFTVTIPTPSLGGGRAILAKLVAFMVALRNRHELGRLLEFNDIELKDLGLVRNDLLNALDLPLHQDPTRRLQSWRAERRGGLDHAP